MRNLDENLLTTAEFGELCGVTAQHIRALCRQGRIRPAVRKGGRWLISRTATVSLSPERARKPHKLKPPPMTVRQAVQVIQELVDHDIDPFSPEWDIAAWYDIPNNVR